ncbi:Na-translocating system protein MpsC family protein [Clostridium ganghwense]|uniref:Stage 0 sporulation protein A homolog n=1 Tax=Clostridium ganghwense TaxID=312089 RepID=A0ABT4CRV4_9CLOT|nr:Na-translocating system protein MpsC family protein [Clostridium ganghwense]MCY6371795.1 Na-translocating system protein MpsC family protein [Clostridium ganghwense]
MENVGRIINNIKVLYVEDEEITRIVTKKILKKVVGKLFIAKDGQEGFELFRKYRPDIVITDLRMPILDGIGMIKKIRDFDQECGIIINTEVEDMDYILKSVDIGIDKYVLKPIEQEEMLESLQNVLFKVIKRKKDKNKLYEILKLSKEEKKKIEDEIKVKVPSFIKQSTGKGPRDVQVFCGGSVIEVRIYDVLTPMEKVLLDDKNNLILVEYYRKLFYKQIHNQLVNLVKAIIKTEIIISKININVLENMEQIVFEIKFDETFKLNYL